MKDNFFDMLCVLVIILWLIYKYMPHFLCSISRQWADLYIFYYFLSRAVLIHSLPETFLVSCRISTVGRVFTRYPVLVSYKVLIIEKCPVETIKYVSHILTDLKTNQDQRNNYDLSSETAGAFSKFYFYYGTSIDAL